LSPSVRSNRTSSCLAIFTPHLRPGDHVGAVAACASPAAPGENRRTDRPPGAPTWGIIQAKREAKG
jgi:hypothetical protein